MNLLDWLVCVAIAALIWSLWQQLEKAKEQEIKNLIKARKGRKKKRVKKKASERIIIDESELNFKKAPLPPPPLPEMTHPLSSGSAAESAPPQSELTSKDSSKLETSKEQSDNQNKMPQHEKGKHGTNSEVTDAIQKKTGKLNESGPEWGALSNQKTQPQKPWMFEGEANYPPNFFTVAHQSH
ncbi:unnamed protein product [Thelazia callipaeda]|uniref:Uncharacterized protein n=1 Tax=Thelazia callipaeda TaxID=103827 RepID=A0A0N5D1A5_THECL|nr:unnamed protein product [Thelazia callipaeda]